MPQRRHKLVLFLAFAAIALVLFATTADLLPHRHDNVDERVCPICHPPLVGLRPAALRLPSLTDLRWGVVKRSPISALAPFRLRASSRAPPAA